ncbi:Ms4527A family Cys-rich leader peptide [Nocardia sp. NBC_01009]|uniref:Ms4527A family Cys-rich leader peptide n=1 Tax=Nocardia sp. NBC_01009 TaxID=2975996 RepID=UPI00386BCEA4
MVATTWRIASMSVSTSTAAVLMTPSLLPRVNFRSMNVRQFTADSSDASPPAFVPRTMTAITVAAIGPGNFPRIRGKYGRAVGTSTLTWHNGRMRGSGVRLVARRHVDFKRVCSACCLPGCPR